MRAVVHAFFDETGTVGGRDGVFVLAGFVANADRWTAFLDDWAQALHNLIGTQSLHTTDFLTNHGQHKSDDFDFHERMETLRTFANIVRKHAAGAIGIGVDCVAFREALKDGPKHIEADVFCMQQAIAEIHRIMRSMNLEHEAVECYFDQSEKYAPRMLSAWLQLRKKKKNLPRHLLASITFGDAHFVPALQAADMLSCGINRELRASPDNRWKEDSPFRLMVDGPDKGIPFEFYMWSAKELARRRDEIQIAVANNS